MPAQNLKRLIGLLSTTTVLGIYEASVRPLRATMVVSAFEIVPDILSPNLAESHAGSAPHPIQELGTVEGSASIELILKLFEEDKKSVANSSMRSW